MKKKVCSLCGKKLIPDKEAVIFNTKKWDGHTYKFTCNCVSKNIRKVIG